MKLRPNLLLGVVFVLVLILAGLTVVIAANRAHPEPDLTTPEGTAQAYAFAVVQGDDDRALSFLAPTTRCSATLADLYGTGSAAAQLRLAKTVEEEGFTQVRVVVAESSSPFDSWEHEENINLKKVDGTWVVQDDSWPFYGCE